MDQTMRDKLSQLVEELTTSGEPQLNQDKMKEVKKMCKYDKEFFWLYRFVHKHRFTVRKKKGKKSLVNRFRTFWERFHWNRSGLF